jgi:hypothetical protein
LLVQASVELGDASPLEVEKPGRPPLGWYPFEYPDEGLLYHGPPLRCLKQFALMYDGGWGQIVAPPLSELAGPRSAEGWILPSAVLDACIVCCGVFVYFQFGGQLEVPLGIERMRWARQPRPGETCLVRYHFLGRDGRNSRFDFTLHGENDEPILQVIGYRSVRLGGDAP